MSVQTPNPSAALVLAAIIAIGIITLFKATDSTTVAFAITAIGGLAGWHVIKNTGQTGA